MSVKYNALEHWEYTMHVTVGLLAIPLAFDMFALKIDTHTVKLLCEKPYYQAGKTSCIWITEAKTN